MRRGNPFLIIGTLIAISGLSVVSGCGGEEFGTLDPRLDVDGSPDATASDDRNPTGGSSGAGGSSGRGGTGGSSGTGGTGGTGGRGGADAGFDDRMERDEGPGPINDAPIDNGTPETSDGHTDDGPPRMDADAGRVGDATDVVDAPTNSDAPTSSDAKDADSADRTDSTDRIDAAEASADVACSEPITYYKDVDGDGFGTYGEFTLTCVPPTGPWSTKGGDCRDDLPYVKPYQNNSPDPPLYSGTGYAEPAKPQGVSFDYDCSGAEDADPTNSYGVEPACPSVLNCTGLGYTTVNPSRTGPGIDPRCGSTTLKRCQVLFAVGGPALCNISYEATTIPYRCR